MAGLYRPKSRPGTWQIFGKCWLNECMNKMFMNSSESAVRKQKIPPQSPIIKKCFKVFLFPLEHG